MPRAKRLETDLTPQTDGENARLELLRSTQGISSLSGDRAWVFIEEHPDQDMNGPVPVAVNEWNTLLKRGTWINVPVECREALNNALVRKWKTVGFENGLPVKEPYDARSFPYQWEKEFDESLMGSNWFDPRQKPAK